MKEDKIEKTEKCFVEMWRLNAYHPSKGQKKWNKYYQLVEVSQSKKGIYYRHYDDKKTKIKNTLWSYEGRLLQKKNEWEVTFDLWEAKKAMKDTEDSDKYIGHILYYSDADVLKFLQMDMLKWIEGGQIKINGISISLIYNIGERVNYLNELNGYIGRDE